MILVRVGSYLGTNKFREMKVQASIKRRSVGCRIVRRKGRLYVINKQNPRFKQRQG